MVAAYDSLYRAASARMLANPRIQDTPLPRPVKPSVLQLGPLPPLTGGMATVACNLRDSDLRHLCELETINKGKTTPEGRSLVAGVRAQAQLLYGVLSNDPSTTYPIGSHSHLRPVLLLARHCPHDGDPRGRLPRRLAPARRHLSAIHLRGKPPEAGGHSLGPSPGRGNDRAQQRDPALASPLRPASSLARRAEWCSAVRLREESRIRQRRRANIGLNLLFLGNLTRRKGAYDLIAAVEAAARQGVRAIADACRRNEVTPGQRREHRAAHRRFPLRRRQSPAGVVQGEEKRDALDEADCVALPSYAEGLPMAILEGMAAGLPAIATRIGSIPAMIDDGVEGFLVSTGDVEALAARICRLAQDAALRRRMGQAARRRVERDFSQRRWPGAGVSDLSSRPLNGKNVRSMKTSLQSHSRLLHSVPRSRRVLAIVGDTQVGLWVVRSLGGTASASSASAPAARSRPPTASIPAGCGRLESPPTSRGVSRRGREACPRVGRRLDHHDC